MTVKVSLKGVPDKKMGRRALKVAFWKMAALWHRGIMPGHFTTSGGAKYRYRKRSPDYMKRKFRLHGHSDPLVFTGLSRELARIRDIRATSRSSKAVMQAKALNFTGGREELTRTTAGERQFLSRGFTRTFERSVNAFLKRGGP